MVYVQVERIVVANLSRPQSLRSLQRVCVNKIKETGDEASANIIVYKQKSI